RCVCRETCPGWCDSTRGESTSRRSPPVRSSSCRIASGDSLRPGIDRLSGNAAAIHEDPLLGGSPLMLRKILVPLDGSPSAEDALPIARRLARRRNASVELVMVRDLPVEPLTIHTPSTDAQMLDETDFRMAQDYLDSVARR